MTAGSLSAPETLTRSRPAVTPIGTDGTRIVAIGFAQRRRDVGGARGISGAASMCARRLSRRLETIR